MAFKYKALRAPKSGESPAAYIKYKRAYLKSRKAARKEYDAQESTDKASARREKLEAGRKQTRTAMKKASAGMKTPAGKAAEVKRAKRKPLPKLPKATAVARRKVVPAKPLAKDTSTIKIKEYIPKLTSKLIKKSPVKKSPVKKRGRYAAKPSDIAGFKAMEKRTRYKP